MERHKPSLRRSHSDNFLRTTKESGCLMPPPALMYPHVLPASAPAWSDPIDQSIRTAFCYFDQRLCRLEESVRLPLFLKTNLPLGESSHGLSLGGIAR